MPFNFIKNAVGCFVDYKKNSLSNSLTAVNVFILFRFCCFHTEEMWLNVTSAVADRLFIVNPRAYGGRWISRFSSLVSLFFYVMFTFLLLILVLCVTIHPDLPLNFNGVASFFSSSYSHTAHRLKSIQYSTKRVFQK